jgi:hypothetical protein
MIVIGANGGSISPRPAEWCCDAFTSWSDEPLDDRDDMVWKTFEM